MSAPRVGDHDVLMAIATLERVAQELRERADRFDAVRLELILDLPEEPNHA